MLAAAVSTVVTTATVDDDDLEAWLTPREHPVLESAVGDGRFELVEGPFHSWERRVEVADRPDGRHDVTQTTDYELAIPVWGFLFKGLVRRELRRPAHERPVDTDAGPQWWLPPDRLDRRAAGSLSYLCVLSAMAGYLGVLLSQTNTYFKAEFGATNAAVQNVLIGARVGGFLALLIAVFADRRGRRTVLLVSLWAAVLIAATGAIAPTLAILGVSQTVSRAFSAAVALIIAIMAAEEMPAGSRAFAVSVLTMSGALGAGGVVIFLGVADITPWAWRIFYLVPLLWIPVIIRVSRKLPETRRFEVFEVADTPRAHSAETRRTSIQRFALIGATSFLFAIFFTPASGNFNEFLRTEHGYSGVQISLLQVLTNLPGGIAIVVGGRLADSRGRRLIGAIGVAGGVGFTVLMYLSSGAGIWAFSLLATLIGALAVPALGVYGPELFPTSSRGLANGGLNLLGVLGSVVGLTVVGRLADEWGTFSTPIALLAIAPAIIVLLVLFLYPETAHRELEELNPDDVGPPHDPTALDALDEAFEEVEAEHDRTHDRGHH